MTKDNITNFIAAIESRDIYKIEEAAKLWIDLSKEDRLKSSEQITSSYKGDNDFLFYLNQTAEDLLKYNHEEGKDLLILCADLECPAAMNNLSINYARGENGFEEDFAKSKKYLEKAVALGDSTALYNSAVYMLNKSFGYEANTEEAKIRLTEAANMSHTISMQYLACCIMNEEHGFEFNDANQKLALGYLIKSLSKSNQNYVDNLNKFLSRGTDAGNSFLLDDDNIEFLPEIFDNDKKDHYLIEYGKIFNKLPSSKKKDYFNENVVCKLMRNDLTQDKILEDYFPDNAKEIKDIFNNLRGSSHESLALRRKILLTNEKQKDLFWQYSSEGEKLNALGVC